MVHWRLDTKREEKVVQTVDTRVHLDGNFSYSQVITATSKDPLLGAVIVYCIQPKAYQGIASSLLEVQK